jgi:uncharacterized protein
MVPAGVVTAVFQLLLFGVQYFLSQMYKAGTTLLLNDAWAAGHFERQWRPQFGKLVRGLGSLSGTHLRNLFDVRPRSFLAGQLWPIVWASEGLSGKAALARAAHLAGTEPGVAAALAVRQCGILLATALFTPWMLTMIAGSTDAYVTIVTGPKNPLVWFAIVYPTILSVLLFRFFGPSFFFLYLSARRCLAEDVRFSLPSENRERRKRRAARLRPGTKAWLALPTVLSAMLLYKIIPHAKSSSALLDAALEGRKTAVLRELDSGVPVNSSDRRGWTPLMWAVDGGHLELMRDLVTRGADLNARNGSGDTALLVALWHRRTAEAELLMAGGADVKIANDDGRTALDVAAMHGDLDMCKRLLAWGADRTHRDLKDQTALDFARAEGYQEVVSLLSTPTLISPGASR